MRHDRARRPGGRRIIFGEILRFRAKLRCRFSNIANAASCPVAGQCGQNLADLGVNVLPVGVVGDDEAWPPAPRLSATTFPASGVLKDRSYATVIQHRTPRRHGHTARQQVRLDREPEAEPNRHMKRRAGAGRAGVRSRLGCPAHFRSRIRSRHPADPNAVRYKREAPGSAGALSIPATACLQYWRDRGHATLGPRWKRRWKCASAMIGALCAPPPHRSCRK